VPDALRPVARLRLYEQVVARIREYATAAGLGAGDRLPAERELAERLGVSRASIKQAVVVLEVQGLLDVRHGGGMFLRTDSLDVEPVMELVERRRRLPEVLEAREALETKLAELAAERRTPGELDEIDAAVAHMAAEIENGDVGGHGDQMFHAAVTAAAHNPLMAQFMRSIAEQIAESRHESLRQSGRPVRSLAQHRRIADAIREGDGRAAAEEMRRHMRSVSEVRLLTWDPDE
jgi:GntR family transcriptional repressor for pyruvate dehydrogenase complex